MSLPNFASEQAVRWCPGCGDYAVLKHLQTALAESGYEPSDVAIVSGIGCSSRLPYYMSSYGFHTIHGRATTIATGLALTRPETPIFVITGDGDGLSIGLSHLLHLCKRNVNVTVLLLNNRIYGLTKGQASPTSLVGQKTKTSLEGVSEPPFNGLSLVLAAGATMVGRCLDIQGALLKKLIAASLLHQGTSFIEIYQNCPIFNDDTFTSLGKKTTDNPMMCEIWPNQPISFGSGQTLAWTNEGWVIQEGSGQIYQPSLMQAQGLAEMTIPQAMGLLYQAQRPVFGVQHSQEPIAGGLKRAIQTLVRWEHS